MLTPRLPNSLLSRKQPKTTRRGLLPSRNVPRLDMMITRRKLALCLISYWAVWERYLHSRLEQTKYQKQAFPYHHPPRDGDDSNTAPQGCLSWSFPWQPRRLVSPSAQALPRAGADLGGPYNSDRKRQESRSTGEPGPQRIREMLLHGLKLPAGFNNLDALPSAEGKKSQTRSLETSG